MIAFIALIYLPLGMIVLLMDSLTIKTEAKAVFASDALFILASLLWPLVFIWARYQWIKNKKG